MSGVKGDGNGHAGEATPERQSADVRLPNSQRVYVEGQTEGVRVPFREVSLQPTRMPDGRVEANEAGGVYDTSGPWGDPDVRCDVRDGLPALRREWILARGDVEEYEGREIIPQDDGYLTEGAAEFAKNRDKGRIGTVSGASTLAVARARGRVRHADALRTARRRHAGDGIRRASREHGTRGGNSRDARTHARRPKLALSSTSRRKFRRVRP